QQGKGYARQVMSKLESRLFEKGCPKINLQIRDTNVNVIRFYESLGYKADACVSLGKRLIPD
ncbi:MAG: GNAT family N-acetyltransferase, partial [Proteobacteria bacterium]|nr:GNAT family N-acetyltransferase [Pseudomonadota bacterium]